MDSHQRRTIRRSASEALPQQQVVAENHKPVETPFQRILAVVEQPLVLLPAGTLGGIVGVFFFAPVLALCGLCILLGFHRSKVVSGKHIFKVQIPAYVAVSAMTLAVLWWVNTSVQTKSKEQNVSLAKLVANSVIEIIDPRSQPRISQPSPTEESTPKREKNIFRIGERLAIVNLNRDFHKSSIIWISYKTQIGDVISPTAVLIYLDITNLTSHAETIKTYTLSVHTKHCNWLGLIPINLKDVSVFHVYNDISKAILLDFQSNGLNYKLDNAIPGNESIHGWLLFDTKTPCPVENDEAQFKFYGETFSGEHYEETLGWGKVSKNVSLSKSSQGETSGPMLFTVKSMDLSGLPPVFFAR